MKTFCNSDFLLNECSITLSSVKRCFRKILKMIDAIILRAFTEPDCFYCSNKIMSTLNLHFQIFTDAES